MAVWVKLTGSSGTYYLSGATADKSGVPYAGRLINAPSLEKQAKSADTGNPVREVSFSIANLKDDGNYFIPIDSETFWCKKLEISVDGVSEVWAGKVRSMEQQGNGTLTISAVDDTYELFKKPIPDETVRIADFTQVGTEGTNTTIGIPLGGTAAAPIRVRGILVDRVNFIYLLAVGEIQSVVSIEKDRKAATGGTYTTAVGTAGQATYPGYAYVKFNADPRDSAGRWPEVHGLVTGMKLGACTEAQSRNPARILYYLLTTANSGACGWGLGVSAGDIDATSFNTAITACDNLGFKVDGVMSERRAASVWIEQLCRAMRGKFVRRDGKYTLTVDADSASVKTYTSLNMVMDSFGRGIYTDRKNRVVLDYKLDVADGRLLGSAVRDDATSQAAVGINEYRAELLLVADHATANKIADYHNLLEQYGEKHIEFTTLDMPAGGLNQDDVITITRPELGLNSALFRVTGCRFTWWDGTLSKAVVQARSYDPAVFGNTVPPAEPAWPTLAPNLPGPESMQAPAAVSAISLSSDVAVQDADGSTHAYIYGTFSLGARTLFVTIELGLGISPVPVTWRTVAATSTGAFRIDGLTVGAPYTLRFTAHNSGGDATPVLATVTASRDTSAPGIASAVSAGVFFKTTRIEITRNASVSNNLAGYAIYRHTSNDSASASEIGVVTTSPNEQKAVFVDGNTTYATTYYYWVKSISRAGIRSGFSAGTGAVTTSPLNGGTDITARTITADRICAASITAAEITTDYLTALKFRTKATTGDGGAQGDGICFDTTAIKGFAAGSATPNFTLDATNGNITANAGTVGGWTIATYGLYKNTGSATTSAGMAPGDYPFYAGCEYAGRATAPFRVSNAGAITATSGTVGGFDMNAYCLTTGRVYSFCCFCAVFDSNKDAVNQRPPALDFYRKDTRYASFGVYGHFDHSWICFRYFNCNGDIFPIYQSFLCSSRMILEKYNSSTGDIVNCICLDASTGAICTNTCITAGTTVTATANTGTIALSNNLPGEAAGQYPNLCSSGQYLYFGACNSYVAYMDASDNSIRSRGPVGGSCLVASVCVTAGTTFCTTASGNTNSAYLVNNSTTYATIVASNSAGCTAVYGVGRVYSTTTVESGGCVVANAGTYSCGYDIYSAKQIRAAGWYAGPWAGLAAELGTSSSQGYLMTYDRSGLKYYPTIIVGGDAGGGTGATNVCINGNMMASDTAIVATCGMAANQGGSGTIGGLSLYNLANLEYYGIMFRCCTSHAKCASALGDWNMVWTLNSASSNRGWQFKNTSTGCVVATLGADNGNLWTAGWQAAACYYMPGLCSCLAPPDVAGGHVRLITACSNMGILGHVGGATAMSLFWGGTTCIGFLTRACGWALCVTDTCALYVASVTCSSARTIKQDYTQVSVIDGIRRIPVEAWRYRNDLERWHVGPYAEDVSREWPWLSDGRTISNLDGLALRGLQEVDTYARKCFDDQQACILKLESRLAALEQRLPAVTEVVQ